MLTTDYAYKAAQESRREFDKQVARKRKKMSEVTVHWCEVNGWENGHAFSAKDPDAEQIMRRHKEKKLRGYAPGPVYQDEEMIDDYYWVCGPHKAEMGLFQRGEKKAEIAPTTRTETGAYDPEYVGQLEEENRRLDRLLKNAQNE
jgi:hypothetical protein